jgi:hypothetical protein
MNINANETANGESGIRFPYAVQICKRLQMKIFAGVPELIIHSLLMFGGRRSSWHDHTKHTQSTFAEYFAEG